MANELKLERQTWHELECAANNAGGIEVAMVSLPIEKVKALVAGRTRPAAPVEGLVKTCDGKEQSAFEEWANSNHFDMHEHPMHYLFMDKETNAARKGWREAIRYCHEQAEAIIAEERAENATLKVGIKRLSDEQELLSETSDVDLISVVKLAARLSEAEANNAALTARVKELEEERACLRTEKHADAEYAGHLQTQLAAARKALEFYADVHKYPAPFTGGMGDLWSDCGAVARAALEAKP